MNHPTRAEQRRARRALLGQTVTVLLALLAAAVITRSGHRCGHQRESSAP